MSKIIEPLRGVHDILPAQAAYWQLLENAVREAMLGYGYEELRVPIIEQTQLFKRSIGDFTDIVEKEMFSFVDQGDDHITLRPEATAGVVRSVISNGLLREGRLRVWWSSGPPKEPASVKPSSRCWPKPRPSLRAPGCWLTCTSCRRRQVRHGTAAATMRASQHCLV